MGECLAQRRAEQAGRAGIKVLTTTPGTGDGGSTVGSLERFMPYMMTSRTQGHWGRMPAMPKARAGARPG